MYLRFVYLPIVSLTLCTLFLSTRSRSIKGGRCGGTGSPHSHYTHISIITNSFRVTIASLSISNSSSRTPLPDLYVTYYACSWVSYIMACRYVQPFSCASLNLYQSQPLSLARVDNRGFEGFRKPREASVEIWRDSGGSLYLSLFRTEQPLERTLY